MSTRALLIEDNQAYASALKETFEMHTQLKIEAIHNSVESCLSTHSPAALATIDLIFLDMQLQGSSREQALRILKKACSAPILILTKFDNPTLAKTCLQMGASGYLIKTSSPQIILNAVQTVLLGGTWIQPEHSSHVLQDSNARPQPSASQPPSTPPDLAQIESPSKRELDCLHALQQGMTKKEIATELQLSPHTIDTYLRRIYHKLKAHNAREALKNAQTRGWL